MGVNQEEPSLCYVSTPWANNTEVSASTGASGPDSSQPSRNPATARNALGSAWLTGHSVQLGHLPQPRGVTAGLGVTFTSTGAPRGCREEEGHRLQDPPLIRPDSPSVQLHAC